MSDSLPPQRKGHIPQYNRDKLVDLQDKFDELENKGVFRCPEDIGVNVKYVNPSFLLKKESGYRLVTSFGEVAKHSKPTPSLMPDVDSTLRHIGQWKYIIKTDLAKAYYQIPLDHSSKKFCGVQTPFRGIRVYQRCAMGMPGSESALEELMSRVLGDLIIEGNVAKIADDLYCGADTIEDLLHTWCNVLQLLSDNDLRLSAPKTVIIPLSTTILGWIWKQGTLSASPHQVSPLTQCELPKTVKSLRSFIGAYKALAKVIKGSSHIINPLNTLTGGRQSAEKITWTEAMTNSFNEAKNSLKLTKTITIPKRNDQLWIVTDGAIKNAGIGATMYISRKGTKHPLLAGFFSAKLKQHQPRWLPCEIEALSISSACNHFRPYIIQSLHQTHVLTDSKPCVQAYQKLIRGEFSASSRVQTFLTVVNHLNVSVNHLSGSSNQVSDFASRNAPECSNPNCQICKFNNAIGESVVFNLNVSNLLENNTSLYTNRAAWREIQAGCPSITKVKDHLKWGTSPSKKCNKSTDTKRYLQKVSLAKDGLVITKEIGSPWKSSSDKIVVPRSIVPGLLTAIHLKTNHPTPFQLKQVFNRCFFALDIDKHISTNTSSCHTCASLKSLPKQVTEFSTTDPPKHIGQHFSMDVLKRTRQKILVSREAVTSYTSATFIHSEKANDLLEGTISLLLPLHPSEGPTTTVRTDPAPGFQTLFNNQPLKEKGIIFELGRIKNPNKNPIADKAIQELENEILRLEPTESPITTSQLNLALCRLNSRIRSHGLSSYELMFRRNQFTAGLLNNSDNEIIAQQHEARIQNHPFSHKSQLPKSAHKNPRQQNIPLEGSIVYLHNDKSKHKARDQYMVIAKNGSWLKIQKFTKNQLRSRPYDIHCSECFVIEPAKIWEPTQPASSSEDEIEALPTPSFMTPNRNSEALQSHRHSDTLNTPIATSNEPSIIQSTEPETLSKLPNNVIENSLNNAGEHQTSSSNDTSWSSQRPTRARKRPAYLKDYVTSKTKGEEEVATPGC